MRIVILPYNAGSKSAKLLSDLTGFKRMKKEGSKVKPKLTMVINWGCSEVPQKLLFVVNKNASNASNKLSAFSAMAHSKVCTPPFSADIDVAKKWLKDGERVFARKLLNGHSGAGIVNIKGPDAEVPQAPLYVCYIQKNAEYRVHVVGEQVVLVQQKKKRQGAEILDKYIRSHKNGYVFCKHDLEPPPGLGDLAIQAVKALQLDFGAVDIIHGKNGALYVLEVNTAPGLDNSTAEVYANVFKNLA